MKVIIGHAVCSEEGGKYGKPGDQTGKELRKQEWYLRDKGWKGVFRWKDEALAELSAKYVSECVDSVHVGYSQSGESDGRESLDREAAKMKYDIDCLVVDVNCDCSSLIASAVRAVGGKVDRGMYTGNEEEQLNKSGLFIEYKSKDYTDSPDKLKVGDILWGDGHTAMVTEVQGAKTEAKPKETDDKFSKDCLDAITIASVFCSEVKNKLGVDGIADSSEMNKVLSLIVDKLKDKHKVVKEVKCEPYMIRFTKPFRVYADLTGDKLSGSGVCPGVFTIVAESSDGLRGKLKSGYGWVKLADGEILKK